VQAFLRPAQLMVMVTLALAWSGVQLALTVTWAKNDPFSAYR
jgi:hypothetical protein